MVAPLTNDAVRESMIVNMARGRKALAELMTIGQERGEIRNDLSPRHLARAVQQGMFGGFLLWSLDPSLEISGWLDTWVDIVFAGIKSSEAERVAARDGIPPALSASLELRTGETNEVNTHKPTPLHSFCRFSYWRPRFRPRPSKRTVRTRRT